MPFLKILSLYKVKILNNNITLCNNYNYNNTQMCKKKNTLPAPPSTTGEPPLLNSNQQID